MAELERPVRLRQEDHQPAVTGDSGDGHQVGATVSIEVAETRGRGVAGARRPGWLEGERSVSPHEQGVLACYLEQEIRKPVAGEVADRERGHLGPRCDRVRRVERPIPSAREEGQVEGTTAGREEVRSAIAVEIHDHQLERISTQRQRRYRVESPVTATQGQPDDILLLVKRHQVLPAVAVEIAGLHLQRLEADENRPRSLEDRIGVTGTERDPAPRRSRRSRAESIGNEQARRSGGNPPRGAHRSVATATPVVPGPRHRWLRSSLMFPWWSGRDSPTGSVIRRFSWNSWNETLSSSVYSGEAQESPMDAPARTHRTSPTKAALLPPVGSCFYSCSAFGSPSVHGGVTAFV